MSCKYTPRAATPGQADGACVAGGEQAPGALPYADGRLHGTEIARIVLDLEGRSDSVRFVPGDMPCQDVLPLDLAGRRAWLRGFADGLMEGMTA